jgi:curli biogenesis system outer membrane secretion channel CsgG
MRVHRPSFATVLLLAFAVVPAVSQAAAADGGATSAPYTGPRPKVAVLSFSTRGLTSNWWGNFEPGVALSDLVTDEMVNANKFNVLDRTHLDATLSEHKLGASGEVDPQSAITAGHLLGARYLVVGNILQLDQTGASGGGGGLGGFLPGAVGGLASGVSTHRVTIKVAVHVLDALTGQIVQSMQDEETRKGTSFSVAGFAAGSGGGGGGGYGNSQFINSDMGHLIDDEAKKITDDIDPAKFNSGPVAPTLRGHIADVEGGTVIINLGSGAGVQAGMIFDVIKTKSIVDPDSHQTLSVDEQIGKIQIDSVSANASVGHIIAGKAAVRVNVVSEPQL